MRKIMQHKYEKEYTSKEKNVRHALLDNLSAKDRSEAIEQAYLLKGLVMEIIDILGEERISKKNVLQAYRKIKSDGNSSTWKVLENEKEARKRVQNIQEQRNSEQSKKIISKETEFLEVA